MPRTVPVALLLLALASAPATASSFVRFQHGGRATAQAGAFVRFDNAQCEFGYRDSRFKRARDRYIVSALELKLPRQAALRLDYAGVREELAALGAGSPTPALVAEAIARLRRRKLPDPAVIGNAGSFFKNPVVSAAQAQALAAAQPALPQWPLADGQVKLSAAWLIEQAGFGKGFGAELTGGRACLSTKHTLAITNRGNATADDVVALARAVRSGVEKQFGIRLVPEPTLIGLAL